MKSPTLLLFVLLFLFSVHTHRSFAQDSSRIRISLLTCTPGDELYSIFGHSAIRIIDSNSVTDYVFNYGTFNFEDDGFYLKFIRGKLLYFLSVEQSQDFIYDYSSMRRGITEQVLDFSAEEKKQIEYALIENLKDENKFYKYDFFLDNCTSRLRDIILKYKSPKIVISAVMPINTTFREAIHEYLDKGKQYWSKLGIDILLGLPTDKIMTPLEQTFLPDNLMNCLDHSNSTSIVTSKEIIIPNQQPTIDSTAFTPTNFFIALLIIFIFINLIKSPSGKKIAIVLDGALFFSTGALGILLILMWTSTDHSMTKNNYNLLWALPTNIMACFFVSSKNAFSKKYFSIQTILYLALLIVWFFLPQKLNISLIPFVILLLYRSYIIGFKNG